MASADCAEMLQTLPEAEHQFENYNSMPFYVRFNPRSPSVYYVDPYRDARGPAT